MKKSISTIVLLLVALLSLNASAQSSQLTGIWYGDKQVKSEQSFIMEMTPIVSFQTDNSGTIGGLFSYLLPIDEETSFTCNLKFTAKTKWTFSNNTIYVSVKTETSNLSFGECKISPNNTQAARLMEKHIPEVKKLIMEEFKMNISKLIPNETIFENVTISGNIMHLTDGDTPCTFTRK